MRPWRHRDQRTVFSHPLLSLHLRQVAAEPAGERQVLVLEAPAWVNVVAVTAADELVLVRQWRHGTGEVTLEIPGGVVEPGEELAAAAARELLEESGYRATSWRLLGEVTPNPAILSNRCATFLATGLEWVEPARGDGEEELEAVLVPRAGVADLVRSGEIHHALVVAALHLLALADDGRSAG